MERSCEMVALGVIVGGSNRICTDSPATVDGERIKLVAQVDVTVQLQRRTVRIDRRRPHLSLLQLLSDFPNAVWTKHNGKERKMACDNLSDRYTPI